ncbi:hypothetical protein [Pectinatus frisingensis]|uniref:hypothetical protein n=1 Tax=Pectinatus frisingensis TaxID=865 RepID=UPI0018C5DCA2|nr:hypothetical protein [Pectinatus frisingensis]
MINAILAKEGIALTDSLDLEYYMRKQYLPTLIVCKAFVEENTARFELFTSARDYAEANLGVVNMNLFMLPSSLPVNQAYLFPEPMLGYIKQNMYPNRCLSASTIQSTPSMGLLG